MALEDYNMSMQVTAITHRRAPVFASIISQVTPSESSMIKKVAYEPMFLVHLRTAWIKGIRRVVMHEPLTNIRPVIFLQFANGAARTEVWRALARRCQFARRLRQNRCRGQRRHRPANTDAVLWSVAYRANLSEDLQLEHYRSAGHGSKSRAQATDSTLLIDATLKQPCLLLLCPRKNSWRTPATSGKNWACLR